MRRFDEHESIAFTVVDRLLRPTRPASRAEALQQVRESVLRDLRWLLNTRRRLAEVPDGLDEVARSVVVYGLPDLSAFGTDEHLHRELLRDAIEEAIRLFEPRLRDVSVEPLARGGDETTLRFRIDATLIVGRSREPISFDTHLELISGKYKVEEG